MDANESANQQQHQTPSPAAAVSGLSVMSEKAHNNYTISLPLVQHLARTIHSSISEKEKRLPELLRTCEDAQKDCIAQYQQYIKQDALLRRVEAKIKFYLGSKHALPAENTFSTYQIQRYRELLLLYRKDTQYILDTVYSSNFEYQLLDDASEVVLSIFNIREEEHLLYFIIKSLRIEFEKNKQDPISFLRANTFGSKLITSYAFERCAGAKVIKEVYSDIMNEILHEKNQAPDLEIDPLKIYKSHNVAKLSSAPPLTSREDMAENEHVKEIIAKNLPQLLSYCERIMDSIFRSVYIIPYGVRWICKQLVGFATEKFGESLTTKQKNNIVSCYIFLRFFLPSIVGPEKQGLTDKPVSPQARAALTSISRVLEKLCTSSLFKEAFMSPMNDFINRYMDKLSCFINALTDVDERGITQIGVYTKENRSSVFVGITPNSLILLHDMLNIGFESLDASSPLRAFASSMGRAPEKIASEYNTAIFVELPTMESSLQLIQGHSETCTIDTPTTEKIIQALIHCKQLSEDDKLHLCLEQSTEAEIQQMLPSLRPKTEFEILNAVAQYLNKKGTSFDLLQFDIDDAIRLRAQLEKITKQVAENIVTFTTYLQNTKSGTTEERKREQRKSKRFSLVNSEPLPTLIVKKQVELISEGVIVAQNSFSVASVSSIVIATIESKDNAIWEFSIEGIDSIKIVKKRKAKPDLWKTLRKTFTLFKKSKGAATATTTTSNETATTTANASSSMATTTSPTSPTSVPGAKDTEMEILMELTVIVDDILDAEEFFTVGSVIFSPKKLLEIIKVFFSRD